MKFLPQSLQPLYEKHRETIHYLFFGVVTTVVNFVIYYVLLGLGMHYLAAQVIAWIGAVIVAYVTNKLWVFESRARTLPAVAAEFASFVASRLFSGAVETALLWLLVDVITIPENIAKLPVAVLTVVLNYITGKLLVFRKRK